MLFAECATPNAKPCLPALPLHCTMWWIGVCMCITSFYLKLLSDVLVPVLHLCMLYSPPFSLLPIPSLFPPSSYQFGTCLSLQLRAIRIFVSATAGYAHEL